MGILSLVRKGGEVGVRLIDADSLKKEIWSYANDPVKLNDRRWDKKCMAIIADMMAYVDFAPAVTPEPGWISVKDRLPEQQHYVDIIDELGDPGHRYEYMKSRPVTVWMNVNGDQWIDTAEYWTEGENRYWQNFESEYAEDAVTHWMPLPEPPKEGT